MIAFLFCGRNVEGGLLWGWVSCFGESSRIRERRVEIVPAGTEVSDGKGPCPLTPRRAIGPLDTLFAPWSSAFFGLVPRVS